MVASCTSTTRLRTHAPDKIRGNPLVRIPAVTYDVILCHHVTHLVLASVNLCISVACHPSHFLTQQVSGKLID